ncbi:hypothetical protein MJO28_017029 [Puccinia striiformis f. sp. tritici]|nr:hypothetical protein MJO28_017029 [Puccinia striiformis f. sp. tritici]
MMVESQQNGQVKRHVSQGAGIQTAILAISHAVAGQHHGPRGWTAPRTPWLDSTTDPVAVSRQIWPAMALSQHI